VPDPALVPAARAAAGQSVRGFAEALGVDPSTVTRWANGTAPLPPLVTVLLRWIVRDPAGWRAVTAGAEPGTRG
jgi:DNA-binding transcriptional regulator YiaG